MARDSDLELLPADRSEVVDADEALDAAEASALDDPLSATNPAKPPIPFGRTAPFDYATGRFVRVGDGAIPWVSGQAALREWVYTVLQTGRGASPIFSSEFGFEALNNYLGEVDPSEQMATFEERLRDALLMHDRIEDIDDYSAEFNPETGVIEVTDLTIVTDEAEAVLIGSLDTTGGTQ